MKEKIVDRLVSIKSIVTVVLTLVFAYLAVTGIISGDNFLTVFTTVIAFYFGVATEKRTKAEEGKNA